MKDITTDKKPEILINSDASLREPGFSPDGKLVSYRSDEIEGKFQLFVRPFPINDNKIQVSLDDGIYTCWSSDSREIYYRVGDKIMAAKIELQPNLKIVSRRTVGIFPRVSSELGQPDFTVAPDGRLLVLKSTIDKSNPLKVNVIVNWFTELKNKLKNQN